MDPHSAADADEAQISAAAVIPNNIFAKQCIAVSPVQSDEACCQRLTFKSPKFVFPA
jgi:hypothetical protein